MSDLTLARRGRAAFDDEHADLAESFGRFLEDAVVSRSDEFHHSGLDRGVLTAAAEHGFLGMSVPEEDGGIGINDVRFSLALGREAGRRGQPGVALVIATHNDLVTPLVVDFGSPQLKSKVCAGLVDGSQIGALAVSPASIAGEWTTGVGAQATGDGWTLHGTCPQVLGARSADFIVVLATTPGGDTLFVVPTDVAGLSLGADPGGLGARAAGSADVVFEHVSVSGNFMLGNAGAASTQLALVETGWALSLASISLATAGRALETTKEYVLDRRAFGQPIATFQNTHLALGALAAELSATAALFDDVVAAEAGGGVRSAADAAGVKLVASELLMRVVDTGLQFHGGYGYMLEYPIARLYLDARVLRLLHPTSERCRSVVADSIGA